MDDDVAKAPVGFRSLYLDATRTAVDLLAAPAVGAAWSTPSALREMSVGGLAGHLAGQITMISGMLAEPVPAERVIGLHDYYSRVAWVGSDLDTEFNRGIRAAGDRAAADGPQALAERTVRSLDELRATLDGLPDRPVGRPTWGPWSVLLDDFLASRLLEVLVHSDDLAYSAGVATPEFAPEAVELVVDILSRIALRRHGTVVVLRGLARSERAPASISAL